MSRATVIRLERIERRLGNPDAEFGHLSDSEILLRMDRLLTSIGEAGEGDPVDIQGIADLDEQERKRAEFDNQPDVVAARAANVAAGRCIEVPFREGVRWPHLIRNLEWWETTYPAMHRRA